jgi:hypothetical protein
VLGNKPIFAVLAEKESGLEHALQRDVKLRASAKDLVLFKNEEILGINLTVFNNISKI